MLVRRKHCNQPAQWYVVDPAGWVMMRVADDLYYKDVISPICGFLLKAFRRLKVAYVWVDSKVAFAWTIARRPVVHDCRGQPALFIAWASPGS